MSRLPFAASFPPNPDLERALRAFEQGDYRAVREEGERIAGSNEPEEVKIAARALVLRTTADPLLKLLFGLTLALLVLLSVWWWAHNGRGFR